MGSFRWLHEDDWGQVEILPASNGGWVSAEVEAIARHAAKHAETVELPGGVSGTVYTEMYMRSGPPQALADLGLEADRVLEALRGHGSLIDDLRTGTFSGEPTRIEGALAIGNSELALVVVRAKGKEIVGQAFLIGEAVSAADGALLEAWLTALAAMGDLLLVDWRAGAIVRLSDARAVTRYVEWLLEE